MTYVDKNKIDEILVQCYALAGFFKNGEHISDNLLDKVDQVHTQYTDSKNFYTLPNGLIGVMKELTSYTIPNQENSSGELYIAMLNCQDNIKEEVRAMEKYLSSSIPQSEAILKKNSPCNKKNS